MILQIFIFVGVLVYCYGQVSNEFIQIEQETSLPTSHPNEGLRVPELVRNYEYELEEHILITADDYILTMHRIPHGMNNNDSRKGVVFLMHGILSSSADWVVMGPGHGLAFLLADLGYDVWMGNARGNTYSRSHNYFDPDEDKPKYWTFSWHEIGVYDLPAMIDTVLNKTNQQKLYYIGHSQGTTSFFVMTSVRLEYNFKIHLMIALAPIAYMKYVRSTTLRLIIPYYKVLEWGHPMIGLYEFLPSTEFIKLIGQETCTNESPFQEICFNSVFLLGGYDIDQLNKTMLPLILSNIPAGACTKQLIHYSQLIMSGKFEQFNYEMENIIKYGQLKPPKYELSLVTAPVALIYGNNDLLTSENDINRLEEEIANPIIKYKVNYDKFNHLDFLWAIDVVSLLYDKIFELLEQY